VTAAAPSPGSEACRALFPLLAPRAGERAVTYLDSAATALRPRPVVDAVVDALERRTGGVLRAVHRQGDLATAVYEGARATAARYLGALEHEVVFVRHATEALNLVARGWPRPGRIVTTLAEHHSNLLPWTGRVTRLAPLPDGTLDLPALERELAKGDVAIVSLGHISNVTGAEVDAPRVAERVHASGAVFVLDAAQSAPHRPLDVEQLGCDFLALSGHKLGAPGGIGVLYGRAERLDELTPHLRGGGAVESVHADRETLKDSPWRFEAGTPAIECAAGLAAALDLLDAIDPRAVARHERALTAAALEGIRRRLPRARILGPAEAERRPGPVTFTLPGVSPHVLARSLSDAQGICIRSGFHCAEPLHEALGAGPSLRMSFWAYSTLEEVERCLEALARFAETAG